MKVTCPKCGKIITIGSLGRKRLNTPLDFDLRALQLYSSVKDKGGKRR